MTSGPGGFAVVAAPPATRRLIPSRFPPVAAFDGVSNADDLTAVMELEGWTNDRLVAPRLTRLDRTDWVFGRPNASVVMAAFLHGSVGGLRFSDTSLGAWYAATDLATAILEVASGLRREMALTALPRMAQTFGQYVARLGGGYVDVAGHAAFHDPDAASYGVPQAFGRVVRDGTSHAGIRYESVRHPGHEAWVCYRPREVRDVAQAGHFRLEVPARGRVVVRRLS